MDGLKTTSCTTSESDISRLLLFAGANFSEVILNLKSQEVNKWVLYVIACEMRSNTDNFQLKTIIVSSITWKM